MNIMRFLRPLRLASILPAMLCAYACASADAGSDAEPTQAEAIEQAAHEASSSDRSRRPFILPHDISQLSDAEQDAYLERIGDAEFDGLVQNARIIAFLQQNLDEARLASVGEALPELNVFTLDNVRAYLTVEELERLGSFEYTGDGTLGESSTIEKSCSAWTRTNTIRTTCNAFLMICTHCRKFVRDCEWHDIFSAEVKYEECRSVRY